MRSLLLLVPALLGLVVLAGCSEDIAASPDLRAYYTLWGAFDPTADIQAVRIIPITDTVSLGSTDPLPITTMSVELASGAEIVSRDSVVSFNDGRVGHVYIADFTPDYGSQHLFTVTADDGTVTSALVVVPERIDPIRQTPRGVTYPYLWVGAPRLNRVRAEYRWYRTDCEADTLKLPLQGGSAEPIDLGWRTELDLRSEADAVIVAYADLREYEAALRLDGITLIAEVASEDWRPPGGVFDSELLVEPGTFSNVTNGFGFVGAAYEVRTSWTPTFDQLGPTPFFRGDIVCDG